MKTRINKRAIPGFVKYFPKEAAHFVAYTGRMMGLDEKRTIEIYQSLSDDEFIEAIKEAYKAAKVMVKHARLAGWTTEEGKLVLAIDIRERGYGGDTLDDSVRLAYTYESATETGNFLGILNYFFENVFGVCGYGLDVDYKELNEIIRGVLALGGVATEPAGNGTAEALIHSLNVYAYTSPAAYEQAMVNFKLT